MLNIPELEKRWLHYKIKSFLPYLIIFVLIFGIFLLFLFWDTFNSTHTNTIKVVDKNISSIVPDKTSAILTKPVTTSVPKQVQETKKETIVVDKENNTSHSNQVIKLEPSMSFIQQLEYNNNLQEKNIAINSNVPEVVKKSTSPKKVQKQRQIDKQVKITIKKEETQNDLQEVVRRFQNNKNPALSLFIARKYYELGDYSQAYNYALITNQLNKDIEKSWIVFAKSLVKLNKKNDAIRTLIKYIEYSHSTNAMILLDNIRSGKFK